MHQTFPADRAAQLTDEVESLRAAAARLAAVDDQLSALTVSSEEREFFDRISEIGQAAMPHDSMIVTRIEPDGAVRLFAATGELGRIEIPLGTRLPDPMLAPDCRHVLVDDLLEHPTLRSSLSARQGMRSLIFMPIRFDGRMHAAATFVARAAHQFTSADIPVARRLSDRIALGLARHELRAKSTSLDLLDELLATVSANHRLRDVFDRISAIAGRMLPHDALFLPVFLEDGIHARRYTSTGANVSGMPELLELPPSIRSNDWEYELVDDLSRGAGKGATALAQLGFRCALRVPIRLEGHTVAALAFVSKTARAYKHDDVLVARRVAERVALCLANERGVEATRRADEATARALRLESRVRALTEELDVRTGFRRAVGESTAWRQVLTQAAQVAVTETTVLLLGESGTGKEVVARLLHRGSPRKDGPFVALNCAALPEHLLEAELFGFERGAFTGATQSKPGQLEQAAGGVLFLDEVGEMSPSAQAKFLRVLQEREFQRLGGTRVLRTDVRIVAATNRDLLKAIANHTFREDLYYRLHVFAIRLPALRDRRDDILPLSQAFLAEFARSFGRAPGGITRQAKQLLLDYHWPGNVRELRNILERAAILCEGGLIASEHLGLTLQTSPPERAMAAGAVASAAAPVVRPSMPADEDDLADAGPLQSVEKAMIEKALRDARFNKSKAAKELGLSRRQLYSRIRRHGLE